MKFSQPPYPTAYFSEEVWVSCPQCGEPARILTQPQASITPHPVRHNATCTCTRCAFRDSDTSNWSGYVQGFVNEPCARCGTRVIHSTAPTRDPYPSMTITCDACNTKDDFNINWYRYHKDTATDPYFGFDLWLQTTLKDHTLWLYNINHLDYLLEYVEATLRTDDGRHKYSMITNLPQWVKSAKNRETITKKLNRLKRDFQKKMQEN